MTAPASTPGPPRLPRGPFVLLGLMTLTTMGGPFLIGAVLRGGASRAWPPDRPAEWATVLGVCSAVVALMGACLSLAWTNRRGIATLRPDRPAPPRRGAPDEVEP